MPDPHVDRTPPQLVLGLGKRSMHCWGSFEEHYWGRAVRHGIQELDSTDKGTRSLLEFVVG